MTEKEEKIYSEALNKQVEENSKKALELANIGKERLVELNKENETLFEKFKSLKRFFQ